MQNILRTYTRSISGATAVEFAFISPIFLAVIFSLFEIGLISVRTASLDIAVSSASRIVYTGQSFSQDDLEAALCDQVYFVGNCRDNINIELTVVSSFLSPPENDVACRDESNPGVTPAVQYDAVGSAQIAFMRVCLTTPVVSPGIGLGLRLPKTETGKYQIISTTAFLSEPF